MKLIILTCEPNMEGVCWWLCRNTQLLLKKNVPEYDEMDFPELQAYSKAVEPGEGDKVETLLKIIGEPSQKSRRRSLTKKKCSKDKSQYKQIKNGGKRLMSPTSNKKLAEEIIVDILNDVMNLTDKGFSPSSKKYPSGYNTTIYANPMGHPQHRVLAHIFSGCIPLQE